MQKKQVDWLLSNQRIVAIPSGHDDAAADADPAFDDHNRRGNQFSDHPFASKEGCNFLASVAVRHCLTFDVADRFNQHGFNDEDIAMFAFMRPELYYSILGITHANAVGFAQACEAKVLSQMVSDDEGENSQSEADRQDE